MYNNAYKIFRNIYEIILCCILLAQHTLNIIQVTGVAIKTQQNSKYFALK